MESMEHPEVIISAPPLVADRVLLVFCQAVQSYAKDAGSQDEVAVKVRGLQARLANLQGLANMCRLAMIGHHYSFERVVDEMHCIEADFTCDPSELEGPHCDSDGDDGPDKRTMLGAAMDLFAGASFICKDQPAKRDRLIVSIVRAIEEAIAFPVTYSAEAAAFQGEGEATISLTHARIVIANAMRRLLEGDRRCVPKAPGRVRARLEGLARKWISANPVNEYFSAISGPRVCRIVRWKKPNPRDLKTQQSHEAQVGDPLTLLLDVGCKCGDRCECEDRCRCEPGDLDLSSLAVMFCPHQAADVVAVVTGGLQVAVPAGSRTGPIAVVRKKPDFTPLIKLLTEYATAYKPEVDFSIISAVSMDRWTYPIAFCRPTLRIIQQTQTPIKQPPIIKAPVTGPTNPALGSWDPALNALEIVGVHAALLHTGKVLYWSFDPRAVGLLGKNSDLFQQLFSDPNLGSYQIWDPVTEKADPVKSIGRNVFCAGQCSLADGTILVVGGQDGAGAVDVSQAWWLKPDSLSNFISTLLGSDNGALKDVHTYDPIADSWTRWPDLQDGRYYPTCHLLNDGTGFVAGGLSNLMQWVISGSNWAQNDKFETFPPGELFAGPTPQQQFTSANQYPMIQLLPGTRQLFVHINTSTTIFDLDSSSFVPSANFPMPAQDGLGQHVGLQTYPMQTGHVLLPQKEGDKPRILVVGGSTTDNFNFVDTESTAPALLGAFIFEFNTASPTKSAWRATKNPPKVARLLADTVILPDGTVFIVNGIEAGAAAGHSQATVFAAEIFDPVTETFTLVAPNPDPFHPRGYHSTAVLLPDGRVAIAGNTDAYNPGEPNAHDDTSIQIYNPPYLATGPSPVVTGVPTEVGYGSSLRLDTSRGPPVSNVMMIRPCAVTHTVDMSQRAIWLVTTGGAGSVTITIPTDRSLAPPGYYMLFFLTGAGVPSTASFVQLKDQKPVYPPLDLGSYSGDMVVEESFDGDLTLNTINQHAKVTLESRHGSITITNKIDQHSYANLKAATTVSIGQSIDQHSIAQIVAGGDVTIGQKIDQDSEATITSTFGKIEIGEKIDQHSQATLNAGTTVHIGKKIDQHSDVTVTAQGDINIDQKIDQHSTANITSVNGSINIGQAISGNATATLQAPKGDINISQSVDSGSTLNWSALKLNCPHQDGTVIRL